MMTRTSRWVLLLAVFGLMLGLTLSVQAADTNGTIKKVDAEKRALVLTVGGKDNAFEVAPNAKVLLGKQAGKLSDLKAGDAVKVTYAEVNGKLVVSEIVRS